MCARKNIVKRYAHHCAAAQIEFDLTFWTTDPFTDHKYLLLVIDHFTKFTWGRPLPDRRAATVSDALFDCFQLLGFPPTVLTDNGKEFVAAVTAEIIQHGRTVHLHGKPYASATQGLVEEVNKVIARRVRTCQI
jgi:IS30 family transposase